MPTSLRGIANKASSDKHHRFRNLFGLLTVAFLLSCWERVNKKAASGVDRVSARSYAKDLVDNVRDLWDRVKRCSYRAKLVRRAIIATIEHEQILAAGTDHNGERRCRRENPIAGILS